MQKKEKRNKDFLFVTKKIFFSLIIIIFIVIKNQKKIKISLCTLCKNENKYIREFVEHYQNIGVDKIFLYDNNDENGEKIESVISDYINSGFVEIKNYRGRNATQLESINNCLTQYLRKYDWILVNDIDEFIHIKEHDLKKFLKLDRLKNCNVIHLNWKVHTDGEQLYYKNESLFKRFPDYFNRKLEKVKSLIRGRKTIKEKIYNHHTLRYNDNCCNAFGSKIKYEDFTNGIQIRNPDYKNYYFDHFFSKSTEEYIEKKNRGDCFFGNHSRIGMYEIRVYFKLNKLTLEKIQLFENRTGFNLSIFRKQLNK